MFPTLFSIGDFSVSTFGVMVASGFLVGGEMAARSFERFGMTRDDAWRIVVWAMIGGILGSKLWYAGEQVLRHVPGSFWEHFFSRAGMTWYGGLIGGAALSIGNAIYHKLDTLAVMSLSAPTLAVGQALGRVGCFLVGDDYGRASDVPWAVAFPDGVDPIDVPVHPTQLYEVLWLGAAGALLWSRRGRSPFLFGEYLVLAGLGRLWIEAFRLNPPLLGPLTNAQLVAIGAITLGSVSWLWLRGRQSQAA